MNTCEIATGAISSTAEVLHDDGSTAFEREWLRRKSIPAAQTWQAERCILGQHRDGSAPYKAVGPEQTHCKPYEEIERSNEFHVSRLVAYGGITIAIVVATVMVAVNTSKSADVADVAELNVALFFHVAV